MENGGAESGGRNSFWGEGREGGRTRIKGSRNRGGTKIRLLKSGGALNEPVFVAVGKRTRKGKGTCKDLGISQQQTGKYSQ